MKIPVRETPASGRPNSTSPAQTFVSRQGQVGVETATVGFTVHQVLWWLALILTNRSVCSFKPVLCRLLI